jgi:hypothetical protein
VKKLLALFFISIIVFKYLPIRDISKNIYAVNAMVDDENSEDDLEKKDIKESKEYCIEVFTNFNFLSHSLKITSIKYCNINDLKLYKIPLKISTPPPIA